MTCDRCPGGYEGRRCERCAQGFEGNPTVPGESCVKTSGKKINKGFYFNHLLIIYEIKV